MPAGSASIPVGPGSGGIGSSSVLMSYTFQPTNGSGSLTINLPTVTNANSPLQQTYQDLASGANTILINAQAAGFIFVPPSGNTQTITLKGLTGDTGLPLSKIAPFVLCFQSAPPASLFLLTGGVIAGCQIIQF